MKRVIISIVYALILLLFPLQFDASAQSIREQAYKRMEDLRQRAYQKMDDLRADANRQFALMLSGEWRKSEPNHPVTPPELPKEEPPVAIPEEDMNKPVQDNNVPVKEVVDAPEPLPVPEPLCPILPKKSIEPVHFNISFFGTPLEFLFDVKQIWNGPLNDNTQIAKAWETMVTPNFDNLIAGMLEVRANMDLCDWAYFLLVEKTANSVYPSSKNGASLLTAFLMCQSGFDVLIARCVSKSRIYCCVASDYTIFNCPSFNLNSTEYYLFDDISDIDDTSFNIFPYQFPGTNKLRLPITQNNNFYQNPVPSKAFDVHKMNSFEFKANVNANLIEFYKTYPRCMLGDDLGSQWRFYAQSELSVTAKKTLYPNLEDLLYGKSEYAKVSILLKFAQLALNYKKDDEVWGTDRVFFPEETLFYPYQDCEDRAIFLSRLVRDLTGLDCVLIYYTGHLAMGVHFNEDVSGSYVTANGRKYVICDPCYIPADVGEAVNKTVEKVILL